MPTEPAVPAPIRQLVDVFEAELADVSFPEVSAAILTARTQELETAAEALQAAEDAVAAARRAHADARTALDTAAERGLGYARVYASDDENLLAQLDAIGLRPKPTRRKLPPKRRPRRPRAKAENVAELPLATG